MHACARMPDRAMVATRIGNGNGEVDGVPYPVRQVPPISRYASHRLCSGSGSDLVWAAQREISVCDGLRAFDCPHFCQVQGEEVETGARLAKVKGARAE
jgi:hypothetical protein